MPAPLLELRGIAKSFGTTRALCDIAIDLVAGETHALVGENGAGKSTLLGILAGVVRPDQGSIAIAGRPVVIEGPAHAQNLGIRTVFQELSLAGPLTVAENIFVGRLPTLAGLVRWPELRRLSRDVLSAFAMDIDVDQSVDSLPVGTRQLVEIAKALSLDSRILLLDEPTSALTTDEVDALISIIARLKASGIAIVYVSHKLAEVFRIADRITVLRDGMWVSTRATAATSPETVIREMVGREVAAVRAVRSAADKVALSCHDLSRRNEFAGIDLALRFGEIVGLAGLLGARRGELAATLAGILPPHAGVIEIRGKPVRLRGLADAIRHGLGYVPEDRKVDGLFLTRPLSDNLVVTTLRRFTRFGAVDGRATRASARAAISRLHIRGPGPDAPAGALSGGNQQKLMLAKWLEIDPAILIVNEPTKGVDIEAKREIHNQLRLLAEAGKAILVVSSDVPELLAVTDRIVVMREGRLAGEIATEAATEEAVMALASGTGTAVRGRAA